MNLLQRAQSKLSGLVAPRGIAALFLAIVLTLIPSLSLASSEGKVALHFSSSDMYYLYASLAFGVVALVAAWLLARKTLAVDPGSEKMQSVGRAIREGALAYLKRQVGTMSIFVAILAIALFGYYFWQYDWWLGLWIAAAFVAGVAASYIAGYTGMLLAVQGNTRTAAAALTSYKKALETAFRSGSVAGMVTVGMGLLGASIIFLAFREDAMKLLIGFGFGGSLAALFMRVGGGIFTKAADVGADLVGKVEAGIPEDDPRNPATIADNVGDNVGDCAGMAADIFESYEVTLVAAIILGVATSAIFDQATTMRLVLFALMARGVGIVASIFGILMVRGTDNVDTDPLKPIARGFQWSALFAGVATVVLALFMMGGLANPIQTSKFVTQQQMITRQVREIQNVRDDLAKSKKIAPDQVGIKDILADPRVKAYGVGEEFAGTLQQVLSADLSEMPNYKDLGGMHKVDFSAGSKDSAAGYSVFKRGATGGAQFETIADSLKGKPIKAYVLKETFAMSTTPGSPQVTQSVVLSGDPKMTEERIKAGNAPSSTTKTDILKSYDVELYANATGELAYGIDGQVPSMLNMRTEGTLVQQAYDKSPTAMDEIAKSLQRNPQAQVPTAKRIQVAVIEHKPVDWWRFPLCIVFGILMAFAIERLTDSYVSLHKKPVQEVAGTSTTGPATMIITGFAYAMESSVFSVFAIVVALMAPLLIFPPADYGGYILSFYGIALVGLGLLTTTGYILAMDTFGPISDNAQGVYEMSGEGEGNAVGAKAVQRLDAAGNTTKALTKGFAIATAVVAAVALFHSYLEEAALTGIGLRLDIPEIFLGMLIGGAAPYLFSAFSINAVGRAAFKLINEVRGQFREDPGIMAGTSKPNYGKCVAIVTRAAQQELLGPGILAIALPAAVAFGFSIGKPTVNGLNLTGAQALGGYLAGAILSGQLLAVLLANSGGIWDNAKKYIEDGAYGGKGSEAHKAGVVVDTVGDPFKDTAGPALNPLIKVMNLVALLLAPAVIQPLGNVTLIIITVCCLAALAFSVWWSKRSSLSSELQAVGSGAAPSLSAEAAEQPKRITVGDPHE